MAPLVMLVLKYGGMVIGYSYAVPWNALFRWVQARPEVQGNVNIRTKRVGPRLLFAHNFAHNSRFFWRGGAWCLRIEPHLASLV